MASASLQTIRYTKYSRFDRSIRSFGLYQFEQEIVVHSFKFFYFPSFLFFILFCTFSFFPLFYDNQSTTASTNLTFTGATSDVNKALSTLIYRPNKNWNSVTGNVRTSFCVLFIYYSYAAFVFFICFPRRYSTTETLSLRTKVITSS